MDLHTLDVSDWSAQVDEKTALRTSSDLGFLNRLV